MRLSLAKKFFAFGTSAAMLLAAVPFVASAAVHSAGTNVLSNGTVYFINSSGQKQPYTSAGAFLSYGFNSWSNVQAASAEDLALPTGAFVPPADGSLINDQGTVYLITNGQRAGFTSAANFTGLGYAWSNVIPGDTSFMTTASPISTTAMAHPAGTLVNQNGTVYLMSSSGKQGIPSLSVFNSWGYSFSQVVPANSYDNTVSMSNGVMASFVAGCLSPLSCSGSTPTPTSAGLSVSLASDTPASGSIAKSAKVTFTRLDLSAGSSAVNVSTLVATRLGLSSDSDVSNVYLYEQSNGALLSTGSINNGRVTFNISPALTVPANSTVEVEIRADMNTSTNATTGDSIGYGIASASDANGATGNFPVNGNLMTIAAVSNLGALEIDSPATLATTVNPGSTGVNIGYFQLKGSNQPLSISYIKLTEVGSISNSDVQNIKLLNGTTQVGTTQQLGSDNTVVFDLSSSPLLIPSGNTVNLWLQGDVLSGANRTFQFTIQRTTDVTVTDTTYNTGIVPGLGSATGTSPVPTSTNNQVTINQGSATVQVASSSPTGNIATGANGVILGEFNVTAAGENIDVSSITVTTAQSAGASSGGSASDYLKNGKLVDITGGSSTQVGSTASELLYDTSSGDASKATTFTIPGYWVIPAGTTRTLAVEADTTAGTASATTLNGETISAELSSISAQGASSLQTITLGTATGRVLTLSNSSLTVAANLAVPDGSSSNITGVSGQTNVKVASFTLTAGSAEGANISSISLTTGDVDVSGAVDLQNVKLMYGSTQIGSTQTTVADSTAYSFSPSSTLTVPVGGSITLNVYADLLSGLGSAQTITDAVNLSAVTATGATSSDSITATGTSTTNGQDVYIATGGTLTFALDPQTPTTTQLQQEVMGTTGQTLAVFNLAASAAENINVTKLVVTDTTTHGADLENLQLWVGGAQVGPTVPALSATTNGTATFNMQTSPLVVPANSNVSVYVKADINTYPSATSGGTDTLNIASSSSVTALGAISGTAPTISGLGSALDANQAVIYKTSLSIAKDATSPSGASSPSSTATVAVFDVTNASNQANQQATLFPQEASGDTISFTLGGTDPIPASGNRVFAVYKSTNMTTPLLKVTMGMGTSPSGVWSGTLTFNCLSGGNTATFTGTGSNTIGTSPTMTVNDCSDDLINAGQTTQYIVEFDTSDATTGKNFTLSLNTQGSNVVWYDGVSNISTLNTLPLTFGTLTY